MFPLVRAVFSAFLILSLDGCVSAAELTEQQFTHEFIARALKANPSFKYTAEEPLVVEIDRGEDGSRTMILTGIYNDYVKDPDRINDLMGPFVRDAAQRTLQPTSIDVDRIVPVIKDNAWVDEAMETIRGQGGTNDIAHEPLNTDLIIVYALDTPERTSYLSEAQLKEAGFDGINRRKRATANLLALMPPATLVQAGSVFMAYGGIDYAPSAVLFNDFWRQVATYVKGDIVLAVPARDMLLFTGTGMPKGVEELQAHAEHFAKDRHTRLTTRLFRYQNGKLKRYRKSR